MASEGEEEVVESQFVQDTDSFGAGVVDFAERSKDEEGDR